MKKIDLLATKHPLSFGILVTFVFIVKGLLL